MTSCTNLNWFWAASKAVSHTIHSLGAFFCAEIVDDRNHEIDAQLAGSEVAPLVTKIP